MILRKLLLFIVFLLTLSAFYGFSRVGRAEATYACRYNAAPVEANSWRYTHSTCIRAYDNYSSAHATLGGDDAACYQARYAQTYNYTNDIPALKPSRSSCSGNNAYCGIEKYNNYTCNVVSSNGDIGPDSPHGYYCNITSTNNRSWVDHINSACRQTSCTKPGGVNCSRNNKCHAWDTTNSCGTTTTYCGSCSGGYSCVSNSNSGTSSGGNCVKDTTSCVKKNCSDIGADGTAGAPCGNQHTACGVDRTCQDCNSGYKCTGKKSGYGGHCTKIKTTTDPSYKITVLVFYDTGSNSKESTYSNCYPATTSAGGGTAKSGAVSVFVNNKDAGVDNQSVSYTSYKNCRLNGKSSAQLGYSFTTKSQSKALKLTVPSNYQATGYNYTVGGKTTVVDNGSNITKTLNTANDLVVRFGIIKVANPPAPKVHVLVFEDRGDGNGQYESGGDNPEPCYAGTFDVKIGSTVHTITQNPANDGSCDSTAFDNSGTQTVKLNTMPSNYQITGYQYYDSNSPTSEGSCRTDSLSDSDSTYCVHDSSSDASTSVSLSNDSEVDFGIQPIREQLYSVSGTIYVGTGSKKGSSPAYSGGQPKTISAIYTNTGNPDLDGTVADSDVDTQSTGYTLSGLPDGDYLIEYTDNSGNNGPPLNYTESYPSVVTPPPTFLVGVGAGDCYIQKAGPPRQTVLNDASCSGGNIIGLNFGITNAALSWFQSVGGDMRIDSDLTDPIPGSGYYASIAGASPAIDPGIIITDQSSAHFTSSGSQNSYASTKGWLSLSNPYNPISNGTRASYEYLSSTISRGGISTTPLFGSASDNTQGPCYLTDNRGKPYCQFPGSMTNRVYLTTSDLNIANPGTYTFQANKNYIFLVNGDITIQTNLIVPTTSTVAFAAMGNITVAANVTEIDGIYSADGKFITAAGGNALKVYGTVIANANLGTKHGSIDDLFNNNRDLGASNATAPSVSFIMRPDFILNLPGTIRIPNYVIQEVAPGPDYQLGNP